jgi:hypothetical protein
LAASSSVRTNAVEGFVNLKIAEGIGLTTFLLRADEVIE